MFTFVSPIRSLVLPVGAFVLTAALSLPAVGATLCVNPAGSGGCYATIQSAVAAAHAHDTINVGPGTYKEGVVIGIPLSLLGAGAQQSIIDATNLGNGVLIDGFNHAGLQNVIVSGFTVKNAQWEGILVVSATDVTIRGNEVIDNDDAGPVFTGAPGGCAGQPAYETDETGDCGGAIHLLGSSTSIVTANYMTNNADGILITDETAASHDNLITGNIVVSNPLDCGIVLASHPPIGSSAPHFAPHFGIFHNTVSQNISSDNGVKVGGAGVGLFSDGNGPGRVSGNEISNNRLIHNGIGGVSLHTHVGPAFGAPADNMDNNTITGNYIAKNLADTADTATPGPVGINISSGGGGSPVTGTVIAFNTIEDEAFDIAINTPARVDIHFNNLLGDQTGDGKIVGVGNVCAYDNASICTGVIEANQNFWGCPDGPGAGSCSSTYGGSIISTPWLTQPVIGRQ
jgi:hypothetical protein